MPHTGTFDTIDCPTDKISVAYNWLLKQFSAIDSQVRKIQNPHDFGYYPSFEIDYPIDLENRLNSVIDDECFCGDCPDCKVQLEHDAWCDKANAISARYSKRFEKYL